MKFAWKLTSSKGESVLIERLFKHWLTQANFEGRRSHGCYSDTEANSSKEKAGKEEKEG